MSAGAIFQMVADDGKADKMIMATELLSRRIKAISCAKQKYGMPDPTPSITDIEKSHIIFVSAHFKPFTVMAFEYQVTKTKTGSPTYGTNITFEIELFGDFLNDMVLNIEFNQVQCTAGTVPLYPSQPVYGALVFAAISPQKYEAPIDATHCLCYTYKYLDQNGAEVTPGTPIRNFVRYCEYPGERILKKVSFDITGAPIDDYISDNYIFYRNMLVAPNKLIGWKKLMGQEIEFEGISEFSANEGSSNYGAYHTALNTLTTGLVAASPAVSLNTIRKKAMFLSGPQTPKLIQPNLHLWVPLLFWFNLDVSLSLPVVSMPSAHRRLTIELERQEKILYPAPGALYLELTTEVITNSTGTSIGVGVTSISRYCSRTPILATGSVVPDSQVIQKIDLYTNNIFIDPQVHDIYINKIGFNLIRVHRNQISSVDSAKTEVLLSALHWPIERIFFGVRPRYNIDNANKNQYRDWHRMCKQVENVLDEPLYINMSGPTDPAATYETMTNVGRFTKDRFTYFTEKKIFEEIKIVAHSVTLIGPYADDFFSTYIPYRFGNTRINSIEAVGIYIINFSLYPEEYQPSGHLNLSRLRETYLTFRVVNLTAIEFADLIIDGRAINFLLTNNGNSILRYTT